MADLYAAVGCSCEIVFKIAICCKCCCVETCEPALCWIWKQLRKHIHAFKTQMPLFQRAHTKHTKFPVTKNNKLFTRTETGRFGKHVWKPVCAYILSMFTFKCMHAYIYIYILMGSLYIYIYIFGFRYLWRFGVWNGLFWLGGHLSQSLLLGLFQSLHFGLFQSLHFCLFQSLPFFMCISICMFNLSYKQLQKH